MLVCVHLFFSTALLYIGGYISQWLTQIIWVLNEESDPQAMRLDYVLYVLKQTHCSQLSNEHRLKGKLDGWKRQMIFNLDFHNFYIPIPILNLEMTIFMIVIANKLSQFSTQPNN